MSEETHIKRIEACFHQVGERLFFCHFPGDEDLEGCVIWGHTQEEIESLIPEVIGFIYHKKGNEISKIEESRSHLH